MMNYLLNTGDKKMDDAYMRMQEHVSKRKTFDEFSMYFSHIVTTDDPEKLNTWLLKVLFVQMKQVPKELHDFDKLLSYLDPIKKKEMEVWLQLNLEKYEKGK